MPESTPTLRLYLDATIIGAGATQTVAFGPFSSWKRAERGLISLISRENVLSVVIRDPGGR